MNWLKQLLSRRRLYGDLSEEVAEHIEEKIEDLVASGMSRNEAAVAARRESPKFSERVKKVVRFMSLLL